MAWEEVRGSSRVVVAAAHQVAHADDAKSRVDEVSRVPTKSLRPISTTLFDFKGPFGAQWEVISAGVILVIIPTLIAFLVLQRFIYNGFTAGAGK